VTALSGWTNFYVIVGSSAGALIGLQFVVMALVANIPRVSNQAAGDAFATPNVVHFSTVLLLSAALCAPWRNLHAPSVRCGVLGLVGLAYAIVVTRRLRAQTAYRPVFEDWLFHALLPLAAYATLAASAYAARSHSYHALFGIAAAALLLLFIGFHNAWDAAAYHVFVKRHQDQPERTG